MYYMYYYVCNFSTKYIVCIKVESQRAAGWLGELGNMTLGRIGEARRQPRNMHSRLSGRSPVHRPLPAAHSYSSVCLLAVTSMNLLPFDHPVD